MIVGEKRYCCCESTLFKSHIHLEPEENLETTVFRCPPSLRLQLARKTFDLDRLSGIYRLAADRYTKRTGNSVTRPWRFQWVRVWLELIIAAAFDRAERA